MGAGRFDFSIERNSIFRRRLTIKNYPAGTAVNITGFTFFGQFRSDYEDQTAICDLTVTIIDAPNGVIEISLTEAQTSLFPYDYTKTPEENVVVFDLKMNGERALFSDSIKVKPEASRE